MKRIWFGLLSVLVLACDDTPGKADGGDGGSGDGSSSDSPTDGPVGDTAPPFDAGPSACDPTATWAANQLITLSTQQADRFGSTSANELSIAWMTVPGTVMYADRQNATDAWGATQTLTGAIALDRVSLSADGLTLIVVQQSGISLTQSKRASRGAAFSSSLDATPYSQLDPPLTETDAGNAYGLFSDPVLSPDGTFLYYSEYGVTTFTMFESNRAQGDTTPWPQGRSLTEKPLIAASVNQRKRPTGLSIDNRTLFFWDETANIERAAFRDATFAPHRTYTQFVDVGAGYRFAAPTQTCGRIYFSSTGAGAFDLFYADKQ